MIVLTKKQFDVLTMHFTQAEIEKSLLLANMTKLNQVEYFVETLLRLFVNNNLKSYPDMDLADENNIPAENFVSAFSAFDVRFIIIDKEYIINSIHQILEDLIEESENLEEMTEFENELSIYNINLKNIAATDIASQKTYVLDILNKLVNRFEYSVPSFIFKTNEENLSVIALIDELNKFFKDYEAKGYVVQMDKIKDTTENLTSVKKNFLKYLYENEQTKSSNMFGRLVTVAPIKIDHNLSSPTRRKKFT